MSYCKISRNPQNLATFGMLSKPKNTAQLGFYSTFEEQLNHHHPLYKLANTIDWKQFDDAFAKHYNPHMGAPAKPIRLMVSLLILKQLRNLSDESVVEQWSENAYYQYFSGQSHFAANEPCEATELVHFRKRIGEPGMELIFKESIRINGKDGQSDKLSGDTSIQEKNITYPTDDKLYKKIISKCVAIAQGEQLDLRQSYKRTVKKLSIIQRMKRTKGGAQQARKASRRIKTIAGRLVRELNRKLSPDRLTHYANDLQLFGKVLSQKRSDTNKIYSLHEPDVKCYSKGKEHKKYEFGSKISILVTQNTGVIVGAINIEQNIHDSKTIGGALEQHQRLTGICAKEVFVDRGYRGITQSGETKIQIPRPDKNITKTRRKGHSRRAAIEPTIGHLKQDHRMGRNFLKGIKGDAINVLMAAAAMNFKRMMNQWKEAAHFFVEYFLHLLSAFRTQRANFNYNELKLTF
jgi:IS5 family transposase